jgi:cell wall-associated NlpC family hydrolase
MKHLFHISGRNELHPHFIFILLNYFSHKYYSLLILISVFSALLVTEGCMTSSPRFTNEDFNKQKVEEEKEDNILVETEQIELSHNEVNQSINHKYVYSIIRKYIGIPYKYGGKNPSGFDCSGFTSYIYLEAFRINIKPATTEQYRLGKKIDRSEMTFGDLIFFNTTGRIPSHVGIYVGKNNFAHSSTSKGVTISSLNSSYYKGRFLCARRVVYK